MKLKWGIVGFGKIAADFVEDLGLSSNNILHGIASRSEFKAIELQKKYGLKKTYPSYDAIFQDPDIDIIYIATPHDSHSELSLKAMKHGKHVLCEKPSGINRLQVESMVLCSQENNVFFMEALWTRFNPNIEKLLELIEADAIGEIHHINGDFCFYKAYDSSSRLFDINRAGGALLDIGIYPIFLSYLLLGYPQNIDSNAILHENGIDLQSSGILAYEKASASFLSSLIIPSKADAFILGKKGRIEIESRWHETNSIKLISPNKEEHYKVSKIGRGFYHEIEECYDCISLNLIESKKWSHQNSIDLVSILDKIRSQCGIIYPMDEHS